MPASWVSVGNMTVKITYATMSADNSELNEAFDSAVERARETLGQTHGVIVDGERRTDRDMHTEVSPIDSGIVIGHYGQGWPSSCLTTAQWANPNGCCLLATIVIVSESVVEPMSSW